MPLSWRGTAWPTGCVPSWLRAAAGELALGSQLLGFGPELATRQTHILNDVTSEMLILDMA